MISFTITVHNESEELRLLLEYLQNRIKENDEVVIQADSDKVTEDVESVIENYIDKFKKFVYIKHPLDNDFAQFKNNVKNHCSNKWIFNIDADEVPSTFLMDNIYSILESNSEVDMFLVPRWNVVEGITDEHIQRWGWKFDEQQRVNWPDYQTRIYKNEDKINWVNKVHERLSGFETYSSFPDDEAYCFYHIKSIERQEKQNEFYNNMN
jgi:glycosyltransferase involved in cell wall biosynthesis